MILRMSAAAMALLVAFDSPALATSSIFCTIKDKNMEFKFHGSMGTITGGGMTVNEGRLKVEAHNKWPALTLDVATDNAAKDAMYKLTLGQQWIDYRDLRLWFNKFEYDMVDLILLTKLEANKSENENGDYNYKGTYEFTQSSSDGNERKYTGQANCLFEH